MVEFYRSFAFFTEVNALLRCKNVNDKDNEQSGVRTQERTNVNMEFSEHIPKTKMAYYV